MRASTSAARAAAGLPPRTLVVTPAPAVAAVLAPQQACYSTARSPRTARRVIWPGSNKRKVYASPVEQPKPVEQTPWQPALPAGQLEAYDLSLEWIRSFAGTEEQRAQVNAEHAELRKEIRQAEEELKALRKRKANSSERAEVKAKLGKLVEDRNEVEARLEYMQTWAKYHDPEVRWNWEHGLLDPESHIARYLDRERFEVGGAADQHAQAINQMSLIPDILPPNKRGLQVDLAFRYPRAAPPPPEQPDQWGWTRKVRVTPTRDDKDGGRVICGTILSPKETLEPPELEIRYFGPKERLHTLIMLDPDVPDPANFTYRQKLHWLVPNIPVTAATRLFPSSSASLPASSPLHHATLPAEVVPYLPPHPHKGTRAHRYALVLLAHDRPVKVSESEIDRDSFVLRDFMKSEAFEAPKWGAVTGKKVEVAGLTFFRAAWDEEVCGHIWKDIIGEPEVKYTTPMGSTIWKDPSTSTNLADAYNRALHLSGPQLEGLLSPVLEETYARSPDWIERSRQALEQEKTSALEREKTYAAGLAQLGAGAAEGPIKGVQPDSHGDVVWADEQREPVGGVNGLEQAVEEDVREANAAIDARELPGVQKP